MTSQNVRIAVLTAILICPWSGCDASPPSTVPSRPATQPDEQPQSLPTVKMTIGNAAFTIEVADSEPEHRIGMMFRDSNPADHGMLFIFPDEAERSFWMQNTRIPLDLIYLDRNGKVVSIRYGLPLDLRGIPSGGLAKYVIELSRGRAAAVGLKPGDVVAIPESVREPAR